MRAISCGAVVLACAITAAAAGDRAPARLADTGLYAPGSTTILGPGVRPYSPQYPLWSDGAAKRRWVYIPPGTTIDASNPHEWSFPVGTRFWKEFAFNGRKVETRLIWRASADRWVYAAYQWNEDGTEATLAPADGVPQALEIASGRYHAIPSETDCAACHGTGRARVLGFTALQLSPDRDPRAIHGEALAPGMLTLATLREEGLLEPAPAAIDASPRIRTRDPETRAVMGYMLANCGSCHNGRGEIAAMGPTIRVDDLLRDADAVAASLLTQRTRWQVPGVPEGQSVLVDVHAPERSAILVRMRSRQPSSQMPPLGTVVRDIEAVDRIARWIRR